MTSTMMYWITRCDGFASMATTAFAISLLIFIIGFLVSCLIMSAASCQIRRCNDPDNDEEESDDGSVKSCADEITAVVNFWRKYSWRALTVSIIGMIVMVFMPTTKECAAIYLVPKVLSSDVIQEDLPELWDIAVEWIKDTADSK